MGEIDEGMVAQPLPLMASGLSLFLVPPARVPYGRNAVE
jgi:hypothetical protein